MAGNVIGQHFFFSKCYPDPGKHLRYPHCSPGVHTTLSTKQKSHLEKNFFKKHFFSSKIFFKSMKMVKNHQKSKIHKMVKNGLGHQISLGMCFLSPIKHCEKKKWGLKCFFWLKNVSAKPISQNF